MLRIQLHDTIQDLSPADWERLESADFPFHSYHYLKALETTDCLGRRTGWYPHVITAWQQGQLVGALILYVKSNSYGEYIFDFAWAQAYEYSGLNYYPKLTSAIPFTPATGPKLLVDRELVSSEIRNIEQELLSTAKAILKKMKASSFHSLFIREDEIKTYQEAGHLIRHSFQFHWHNLGDKNFTEFLARLRSKRRREILRERAQVQKAAVRIVRLTGDAIAESHAAIFNAFYTSTIDKRNSFDYLTLDFFKYVFKHLRQSLLLVLAFDSEDRPVAGALNYFGTRTLYGRNWGCVEDYRALHFELCYYQGLEFALERGFERFEAGAQGEHKFQRGFLPRLTYSAHDIEHPELRLAIAAHIEAEKEQIAQIFQEYKEHDPYSEGEISERKNSK